MELTLSLGDPDLIYNIFPDMPAGLQDLIEEVEKIPEDLANDLIQALVIDVAVDLDFLFVVDLNPTFDPYAENRWPNFYIQVNHFDMQGRFGIDDWTTSLSYADIELKVGQASAMVGLNATLSSFPITINSPSEILDLVNYTTEGEKVLFEADLEVDFPVFLTYLGVGAGARIEYE